MAIQVPDQWLEIVGVVADARDDGLGKPVKPGIYVPYTLYMRPWTQILVRAQVPPLSILHGVRERIHSVDADQQAAGNVRSLEDWIKEQRGVGRATPHRASVRRIRFFGAGAGRGRPV